MSLSDMATDDTRSFGTSFFVTIALAKIVNMNTQDLWAAASMLNPGMLHFPFLVYSRERSKIMDDAKGLIRRLLVSMGDIASDKIWTSTNARDTDFGFTVRGKTLFVRTNL